MMHGDKKMKRSGMMYGGRNNAIMGGMKKNRMGMTHGGAHAANPAPAQPTYGSTVADAMPVAGAN